MISLQHTYILDYLTRCAKYFLRLSKNWTPRTRHSNPAKRCDRGLHHGSYPFHDYKCSTWSTIDSRENVSANVGHDRSWLMVKYRRSKSWMHSWESTPKMEFIPISVAITMIGSLCCGRFTVRPLWDSQPICGRSRINFSAICFGISDSIIRFRWWTTFRFTYVALLGLNAANAWMV